jgi:hypothetical protein
MLVALYPTKKKLREAKGQPLKYQETSAFGKEFDPNGRFAVVGPGAYERKWYADVTMKDGRISRVS